MQIQGHQQKLITSNKKKRVLKKESTLACSLVSDLSSLALKKQREGRTLLELKR
jgi:hypothetical protein